MSRSITVFLSIVLLATLCLGAFCGCNTKRTTAASTMTSKTTPEECLYNWLLDNGELVNGSDLLFEDSTFVLKTNYSKELLVSYTIPDYKEYEITIKFPLIKTSENVKAEIRVNNNDSYSTFACYFCPETFTSKTPLEFVTLYEYPLYDTIDLSDYGTLEYENGKYVFRVDEHKREEYEKAKNYNNEITVKREHRESIAREISHKLISEILDWLNTKVFPSASVDISDFGYKAYVKRSPQ